MNIIKNYRKIVFLISQSILYLRFNDKEIFEIFVKRRSFKILVQKILQKKLNSNTNNIKIML